MRREPGKPRSTLPSKQSPSPRDSPLISFQKLSTTHAAPLTAYAHTGKCRTEPGPGLANPLTRSPTSLSVSRRRRLFLLGRRHDLPTAGSRLKIESLALGRGGLAEPKFSVELPDFRERLTWKHPVDGLVINGSHQHVCIQNRHRLQVRPCPGRRQNLRAEPAAAEKLFNSHFSPPIRK